VTVAAAPRSIPAPPASTAPLAPRASTALPAQATTASDVLPPTRDEFVAAWGDHVLSQLRPRVRAVFAVGRFVGTEGATAILALPNSAHVERASSQCEEVAEALGRYFGRRIDLRLVAETDVEGASATSASGSSGSSVSRTARDPAAAAGDGESPPLAAAAIAVGLRHEAAGPGTAGTDVRRGPGDEMLDPDDLDPYGERVGGDSLSWAQDRLMEAFPGAEEV